MKNLMQTITFDLPSDRVVDFMTFYQADALTPPTPFHLFFAKSNGLTLSVYQAKKGVSRVVIQGEGAKTESLLWMVKKEASSHGGSDEVGTGDFFGPIVVVASYVDATQMKELSTLGIKDSKQLDDSWMKSIASTLASRIPHVTVVIHPQKYAAMIAKGMNMNHIKAAMHHKAIFTLKQRYPYDHPTIIDQFATDASMHRYLKNLPIIPRLQWFEKAENNYMAVAVSSILARVRFLEEMQALNEQFHTTIPLGASQKVEDFAVQFAQIHGIEQLKSLVKINFSTFQRVESIVTKRP